MALADRARRGRAARRPCTPATPKWAATTRARAPPSSCTGWVSITPRTSGRSATFSGGWRVRINVARALMCRSDLLLLDEPTNHLDIDAILWLEGWLRAYPGTLLLIAHDREFLDRVCNRIVNIEHEQVHAYRGNYSGLRAAARRASWPSSRRSMRASSARSGTWNPSSSASAPRPPRRARRRAASRRSSACSASRPAHVDSAAFEFAFAEPDKLPRPLLAIDEQSVGYGGRALLRHVKFTLMPGDRLALLGRNGAGKTTCMKLLAGELRAQGGTRTEARDLGSATSRSTSWSSSRPTSRRCENLGAPVVPGAAARPRRSCAISWPPSAFAAIACSSRWGRFRAARRRAWCWRW